MGILYNLRKDYQLYELTEDLLPDNPLTLYQRWFKDLADTTPDFEPNAMVLSTVSEQGFPSSRVVLLKSYDEKGFVFFTNYNSRKAKDLTYNPNASLLFFWHPQERQVRIEGRVEKIANDSSVDYFNSRPRDSKIGAWSSPQSKVIPNREYLTKAFNEKESEFGNEIPKPDFWGGYVLKPHRIEFWQGRKNRLHDRIEYLYHNDLWEKQRLAP